LRAEKDGEEQSKNVANGVANWQAGQQPARAMLFYPGSQAFTLDLSQKRLW
jgi:hypothetical protein